MFTIKANANISRLLCKDSNVLLSIKYNVDKDFFCLNTHFVSSFFNFILN